MVVPDACAQFVGVLFFSHALVQSLLSEDGLVHAMRRLLQGGLEIESRADARVEPAEASLRVHNA